MVVSAIQSAALDKVRPLVFGDGTDLAQREENLGPFHHGRGALFVQEGNQGFAGSQLQERVVSLEGGIGAEGIGRNPDGFLVLGRVSAEGVLYAVTQLTQDVGRNVRGALGNEVDAHTLGTDEADHLLDLVRKGLGSAFEQHVGLVKEEHQLGKVHLPYLRQGGVKLRKQPQQEGGIEFGLEHEFIGRQHVHDALAGLALQEVVDIEIGLSEELLRPLVFQGQQGTLDSTHRGRCHIAVLGSIFRRVLSHEVEHGAEVLEVYQEKAVVIGNLEDDVENARLGLVQVHQAAQHIRSHAGNGGTHGVALLPVHVEKAHRTALELRILYAELRQALLYEAGKLAYLRDAAEVSLHIGHETGYAGLAESLCQHLQGNGFTGTGGTGDESVAAGHLPLQGDGAIGRMGHIEAALGIKHSVYYLRFFQR